MVMRIRRGRRTDFEALAALGLWPRVDDSPRRSIRLFRNVVADLAYDLYVADEDGTAVGVIAVSYVRSLGLGGQRANLEELVVRADRRGSGIGRQLVDFVVRRALRRGARVFRAWPTSEIAGRFLEHVGFHSVGRVFELDLGAAAAAGAEPRPAEPASR